jgi:multidrug resistance efflux pump
MEYEETRPEAPHVLEKQIIPPPPRSKRGKLKLFVGVAVLIVLVAAIFYYLRCVAPYESTDDAFIDGYVTLVSPRVPGQITQLLVKDNQEVKAGDMLVEIDPRDYEAKAAQARADLAASQSQLNESQAQAAVTAAEAESQRAADDLKRYENVESIRSFSIAEVKFRYKSWPESSKLGFYRIF